LKTVFDMGVKLGFMPKAKNKAYECSRQDHDEGIFLDLSEFQ